MQARLRDLVLRILAEFRRRLYWQEQQKTAICPGCGDPYNPRDGAPCAHYQRVNW